MEKPFNIISELQNALKIPLLNKTAVSEVSKNGSIIFGLCIIVIPYFLISVKTFSDPEMVTLYQDLGFPVDIIKLLLPILFAIVIAGFSIFYVWVFNLVAQKMLKGQGGFKGYLRPHLYSMWFGMLALIPFSEAIDAYAQSLLSLWGFVITIFIAVTVYKFSVLRAIVSLLLTTVFTFLLFTGVLFTIIFLRFIILIA